MIIVLLYYSSPDSSKTPKLILPLLPLCLSAANSALLLSFIFVITYESDKADKPLLPSPSSEKRLDIHSHSDYFRHCPCCSRQRLCTRQVHHRSWVRLKKNKRCCTSDVVSFLPGYLTLSIDRHGILPTGKRVLIPHGSVVKYPGIFGEFTCIHTTSSWVENQRLGTQKRLQPKARRRHWWQHASDQVVEYWCKNDVFIRETASLDTVAL